MANFDDFTKVLMAANENIKEMEKKTKIVSEEISHIKNDRWKPIVEFWREIANAIEISGLRSNSNLLINTPIFVYGNQCKVSIYVDSTGVTELGVYVVTQLGDDAFIRWLHLYDSYERTERNAREDARIKAFVVDMMEHWEEYEDAIAVAFKEAATEHMAERVRKAETNHMQKVNELMNL